MKRIIGFFFSMALAGSLCLGAIDYPADERLARDIGSELWNSMDRSQRELFPQNCVLIADDPEPWVAPVRIRQSTVAGRYVAVSRGCIDLINRLSHAAAIDQVEPGYLRTYMKELVMDEADAASLELDELLQPQFWTEQILNAQQSNFNQMLATVVAIQMAHHELGHVDQQSSIDEGRPINTLVDHEEWLDALALGLHISLNAGYGVEGFHTFCEALRQATRHPDWAAFFVPPRVDLAALQKQLENAERAFFNISEQY